MALDPGRELDRALDEQPFLLLLIRPARDATRRVLATIFGPPANRLFAVRYWDGTVDAPERTQPRFTLVLRRPGALRRMLLPPSELSAAHAYIFDDVDYEGDFESVVDIVQPPSRAPRSTAGSGDCPPLDGAPQG